MEAERVVKYRKLGYPRKEELGGGAARLPKRWAGIARSVAAIAMLPALVPLAGGQERPRLIPGAVKTLRLLTEADVRQILNAEAKRAHLKFSANGPTIPVELPKYGPYGPVHWNCRLTAWDPKHRVGFAYVTRVVSKTGEENGFHPTYDLPQHLRGALAKEHLGGRVRILRWGPDEPAGTEARRVRHEVRSFLRWLKAQGVI